MVPDTAPTVKIVVLARGLGSRMREDTGVPLTEEQRRAAASGVKAMMPVGRPFLDHCLSTYADAGFREACLVIGPEHRAIRDYYGSQPMSRITVTFAEQAEPRGTADAVLAAEDFVGGDRFVVVNGDNFYTAATLQTLRATPGNAVVGYDRSGLVEMSNVPAERVHAFALIAAGPDGQVRDIVEKPSPEQADMLGPDARVSMNCFAFTPEIFAAARRISPSPRGELEITDAVRTLITDGAGVRLVPVYDGVLDLSRRDDVSSVTRALAGHEVRL